MATLTVGSGQEYATLASAIAASKDGDVLQVKAGTYVNDFAEIRSKITIEGVGGMVNLVDNGQIPNGKAILITDTDVTLDHIAFYGANVSDANGAGIRYQGGNLTLTNDYFQGNQNGILAADNQSGSITISNSEFYGNGSGSGSTHGIYIGDVGHLTITNSYFADTSVGHDIKSRAENTTITNSVIADGANGTASYQIDLPNGGNAVIKNNVIEKGPNPQNSILVSYGEEGGVHANSALQVSGNTIIDDHGSGLAVKNATSAQATVSGNTIYGLNSSQVLSGSGTASGNSFVSTEPTYSTASPIVANGGTPPTQVASTILLDVSEDAWAGDAQFTVSIDGKQVGGTYTATASHAAGTTQPFSISTTLSSGVHAIGVSFINDAYGGSASTDRNLYVDGVTVNGQAIDGSQATLLSAGTATTYAAVGASTTTTPPPTTIPTTIVLNVSEDAWKGDAQFTVSVDGKQVGGSYTATALRAGGQSQNISISTALTAGPHAIGVSFFNDAYGGTPSTDRNLYLNSVTVNGQAVPNSQATLMSNGTATVQATVSASGPTTPPPSGSLVLNVAEDAWQGDAQFTVSVDGQQVGNTYTATASNTAGQSQAITIPTTLGSGVHTVGITFLNDAYGGSASTDRNLYLDSATLNGVTISGRESLLSNGTATFNVNASNPTPVVTSTLLLNVSEDAFQGDAQMVVSVDGQTMGYYTATASHAAGQSQAISIRDIPESFSAHDIAVSFVNDAYGGSPNADRNLYVNSMQFDGQTVAGGSGTLMTDSTQHFTAAAPANWTG